MSIRMTTIEHLLMVGGGYIGEALLSGFLDSGILKTEQICVVETNEEKRALLQEKYGVRVLADFKGQELGPRDACLVAVKPPVVPEVLHNLAPCLNGALVISIAIGITLDFLQSSLPPETPVVRVMPNLPVVVGSGMAQVSLGAATTLEHRRNTLRLFESVGRATLIDESWQNTGAAIAGSGPAYFALVIGALVRAAVAQGLPRVQAQEFAAQTALGAAQMLLTDPELHPEQLIDMTSSPGGITIRAIAELESGKVRAAFYDAVEAAIWRAEELEGDFEEDDN